MGVTLSGTVKIWPLKRNPENKVNESCVSLITAFNY